MVIQHFHGDFKVRKSMGIDHPDLLIGHPPFNNQIKQVISAHISLVQLEYSGYVITSASQIMICLRRFKAFILFTRAYLDNSLTYTRML